MIAKSLSHMLEGGGESTAVYVRTECFDEREQAAMQLETHVAGTGPRNPILTREGLPPYR
jgi:hypothetical protein